MGNCWQQSVPLRNLHQQLATTGSRDNNADRRPKLATTVKAFWQASMNCFEDDCYQYLKLLRWQDGYKEWYKPRFIHGINGEVLIVSQILYYSNGQQITTRDTRILSMIHNKLCIPFILLHKCGLTRDLSEMIFALATQGLSFSNIETILSWRAQERYYQTQIIFLSCWFLSEQSASPPSFPQFSLSSMSNDQNNNG